ncbi:MAG: deoxyribonuclease-1-like protein [Cognaticolwellia sp.]|jgi:endonuclease/exonuclease/phosphatase family metal-dependent hydrolase
MKKLFLFLIALSFLSSDISNTYSIASWNIQFMGNTKDDKEIAFMANQLKSFDIVGIQELIVGSNAGAKAVAKLADELNRKGAKWDYRISDPTTGEGNQRKEYAYLWKTSKATLIGRPYLESKYAGSIVREPFIAQFSIGNQKIRLVNLHAVPKGKQPEREVKFLKFFPSLYPGENLIFMGDFNLSQKHTVFNPLKKKGYKPSLVNQKTSLKQKRLNNGEHLASELDNIFYDSNNIIFKSSGVVDFSTQFSTLKEAKKISDHIPIYLKFELK